jgi:hypothetical protein
LGERDGVRCGWMSESVVMENELLNIDGKCEILSNFKHLGSLLLIWGGVLVE